MLQSRLGMTTPFKIAANTMVQGLGKLVTASTTFLVIVLIGKSLGAQGYGEFAKIFAVVELFYLVADFGLNATVVKSIAQQPDQTKSYLETLLGMRLLIGLALVLVLVPVSSMLPYEQGQGFNPLVKLGIVIAGLTVITQALFLSGNAFFQSQLRYDQSVIALMLGAFAKLGLAFVATQLQQTLLAFVWVMVAGEGVMVVVIMWQLYRRLGLLIPRLSWPTVLFLLRQSWPLGATLIFTQIYFRIDTVLLGVFRPSVEVGYYTLAYRFFDAALVVPIFFANALYPVLLAHYQQGIDKLLQIMKNAFMLSLAGGIGAAVVMAAAAPFVLKLFLQEQFNGAVAPLTIFALQLPIFYLSSLLMWLVIVLNQQRLLLFFYGSGALINVTLNLIFIPHYGYIASAVITGVSELYILLLLIGANVYTVRKIMRGSP